MIEAGGWRSGLRWALLRPDRSGTRGNLRLAQPPGREREVVKQGAISLYHDEHCGMGTSYGPGSVFTTSPDEDHLAKNLSTTDTLVLFAFYFAPKETPDLSVRIDKPLPAPGCPQ